MVPTVEGDPSTEFLMATYATDSVMTFDGFDPDLHFTNEEIMYTSANDYIEYQIISPWGGTFVADLDLASNAADAEVNVSVYKTESETWSETGMTYNVFNNSWNTPQAHYFVIDLEEAVFYTMRISFINAPSHLFGIQVHELCCNYDLGLHDLKIDGTNLKDYDSDIYSYIISLPIGTTSVSVEAHANGYPPSLLTGTGTIELSGYKTVDTIYIEYDIGIRKEYELNFFTPIEVNDGLELDLAGHLFNNNGTTVTDSLITNMSNGDYVEYYIYSTTDKDINLRVNASNGNRDNIYSRLNVQTYNYGSDWLYVENNSTTVPRVARDRWTVDYASDLDFRLSLKANQLVVMRLNGVTNAPQTLAHIFGLSFHEDAVNSVETSMKSDIKVWGGTGRVTVLCNETYVGSTVQIFDVSGRLCIGETLRSTHNEFSLNRSGLYLVKVQGAVLHVLPFKCLIR